MSLFSACVVRGVSRRVIEIPHPDSPCFERAVFYLKPDIPDIPLHLARREAEALLRAHTPRGTRRVSGAVWFLLGAAVCACVCRVVMG